MFFSAQHVSSVERGVRPAELDYLAAVDTAFGTSFVQFHENLIKGERKSTRSGPNGGSCVEVADNLPGRVLVRDSKDRTGPHLAFGPTAWSAFVVSVKR